MSSQGSSYSGRSKWPVTWSLQDKPDQKEPGDSVAESLTNLCLEVLQETFLPPFACPTLQERKSTLTPVFMHLRLHSSQSYPGSFLKYENLPPWSMASSRGVCGSKRTKNFRKTDNMKGFVMALGRHSPPPFISFLQFLELEDRSKNLLKGCILTHPFELKPEIRLFLFWQKYPNWQDGLTRSLATPINLCDGQFL